MEMKRHAGQDLGSILSNHLFQRKISGACRFSRPKKHFAGGYLHS
jgi:hypothetical protein